MYIHLECQLKDLLYYEVLVKNGIVYLVGLTSFHQQI